MGAIFGVVSKEDCTWDLLHGTNYQVHLGDNYGGLALKNTDEKNTKDILSCIQDIRSSQFRIKIESKILEWQGEKGIGAISDYEPQPLIIGSHLGPFAIATVGRINNLAQLTGGVFKRRGHFSEMSGAAVNPTELVGQLIAREESFVAGIEKVQSEIEGSCSMLLLTNEGIYVARDKLGRTPLVIGHKPGAYAATLETCAFPNLGPPPEPGYNILKYLGPGEIILMTAEGLEQKKSPDDSLQICGFLWVYYGFPASSYEKINVELVRNRCGAALAQRDADIEIDFVSGIPDSGIGHSLGYAIKAGVPYRRPYVKYTPAWPRSFMPQDQETRDLVAKMKLIPIKELIEGSRLLFCEDSIVRGTQLQATIKRLYDCGALEVHMRPACPPLIFGCQFLNFSRSKTELDLAARWAINKLEGEKGIQYLDEYSNPDTQRYEDMVEKIRTERLCLEGGKPLTTLRYQYLNDLVTAIGLPKEKLCTYYWDGAK